MLPALVAGVLIAAAIVLALTQLSGLPPGGISRDEAIKIASGYTRSGADVRLITVQAGQFSKFRGDTSTAISADDRWVWAVAFSGRWSASCGPPDIPGTGSCDSITSEMVVLDYFHGDRIMIKLPSPIR